MFPSGPKAYSVLDAADHADRRTHSARRSRVLLRRSERGACAPGRVLQTAAAPANRQADKQAVSSGTAAYFSEEAPSADSEEASEEPEDSELSPEEEPDAPPDEAADDASEDAEEEEEEEDEAEEADSSKV